MTQSSSYDSEEKSGAKLISYELVLKLNSCVIFKISHIVYRKLMGILNFLLRLLSHLPRIIHMLSSHGADKLRPKDDDKIFGYMFFFSHFRSRVGQTKKFANLTTPEHEHVNFPFFSLLISWSDFNC